MMATPLMISNLLEICEQLENELPTESLVLNCVRFTVSTLWHGMLQKELFEREMQNICETT